MPRETTDRERESIQVVLLAVVLLLMPIPIVVHGFTHSKATYDFQVYLFPSDIALFALLLFTAPDIVGRLRRRELPLVSLAWLFLTIVFTLAFVVHPSMRGAAVLLRLLGTLAIAVVIGSLERGAEET